MNVPPAAPDREPPPPPPDEDTRESIVLLISFCRFAEAIAVGMLVPILPTFLASLPADGSERWSRGLESSAPWLTDWFPALVQPTAESRTALLFFLAGMAMSASQMVAGRLSDRFDRRKIFIVGGMLGGAIGSAAFAWSDNYSDLLTTRLLQTACLGLTFPPMMAIVARHSSPGRGGRMLGLYSTIRLLGFSLGPLIGGLFANYGGYEATFLGSAILLLISIGLVTWLVPDPREGTLSRDERRERPPVPWMFRLLGTSSFLMMVGISAIISLFPAYQEEFGATEFQLSIVFTAFIGTRCLFQYASGWIGDRFDKKRLLLGALAALGPLIALQGMVTSLTQLIVLRAGIGIMSAAMSASIGGISAERSVPGNRARVMGINTMCFTLGVSIGPLLTGFIPDRATAFLIPGVAAWVWVVVIALAIPSDRNFQRRGQSMPSNTPVVPSPQRMTPA